MVACQYCQTAPAVLKRPKTSEKICKSCFFNAFETEVHETIIANDLFKRDEKIAIAASGGKDSTVLAHVLTTLNKRYDYGLNLFLLSIDEGITGYRDDSLESVKRNQRDYGIPLKILSYKDLYGWTMDEIVAEIGLKGNCTFCGVFRRQALDRGARLMNADKLVTGHNCDDIAETVLMNLLRGDIARLERCTSIVTGKNSSLPRCKPFKYSYEKEIVMYAYYKQLDYFSTECIYSPNAYRGFAREFLKELEKIKSRSIVDIIRSGEHFKIQKENEQTAALTTNARAPTAKKGNKKKNTTLNSTVAQSAAKAQVLGLCERCGYISSNQICKACALLEGLNKGKAKVAIGVSGSSSSSVPSNSTVDVLPSRSEMSDAVGRIGKIQIENDENDQTKEKQSTTNTDAIATSSATTTTTKKSGVSAPMDMAHKLNSTGW